MPTDYLSRRTDPVPADLSQVPDRCGRRRRLLIAAIVTVVLATGLPVLVANSLLGPHSSDGTVPPGAQPTPITYWPSAANTGVPPGTVLRASGSLTLRTSGQVVSGLDITGCVTVGAANVRIIRSRIRCNNNSYAIRTENTARNLVVEDVEINGLGRVAASVCCTNYTLRRVNIHNSIDGPRLSNNTTVVDSYIHSLARVPDSHNDTLQSTGGSAILVQRNTLLPFNAATNDPSNACLMVGSETAPSLQNLLMVDNYCNGGNWSIGIRSDMVASQVVFRNNKFGRNFRYGVVARPRHPGVTWESNNVFFDDGTPVVR